MLKQFTHLSDKILHSNQVNTDTCRSLNTSRYFGTAPDNLLKLNVIWVFFNLMFSQNTFLVCTNYIHA